MSRDFRVRKALFKASLRIFTFFLALTVAFELNIPGARGAEVLNVGGLTPNPKILNGIQLLYNLQFEDAEKLFQEVIADSRERPAGYFYLAMVSWSRMVAGFWSPEVVKEYKERIDVTIQVAERRIEHHVSDSQDYFYLGGALGFLGRFELMRKNWYSSYRISKRAIHALENCLAMDPYNRDVLLGLGIFDYYTAKLSGVLRFLSYFFFHKADRKEGLRKLHLAAEEAVYSKTEAKSMLLHIYLFLENNYEKAFSLARELGKQYGQDPIYLHFQGVAAVRMENEALFKDAVSALNRKSEQSSTIKESRLWKRRTLYLEAVQDLFHGRYDEARAKLNMILELSDPEIDPAMVAWPLVKIGMSYDLGGDRNRAIKYYQSVQNLENGSGAQFLAERCLDEPPDKRDPMIGY